LILYEKGHKINSDKGGQYSCVGILFLGDGNHSDLNRIPEAVSKEEVMQYHFTCPARGCNFSAKAETENPDWAVEKITEISLFHVNHAHPRMTSLTVDKIRAAILKSIDQGYNF
jgi:hypothetical protein